MVRDDGDDALDEDPLKSDQDSTDEPGLINCAVCGEAVSELADVCPHCRSFVHPGAERGARWRNVWLSVIAVLFILFFVLLELSFPNGK
jgi:predicted nucleic acid-binding Zn ribbon protein